MLNFVKDAVEASRLRTLDRSAVTADGEILEARPEVPFRSITDLKAYDDAQRFYQPSLTDPSLYESLEEIFARCQRGELIAQKRARFASDEIADDDLIEVDEFEDLTDVDDMAENLKREAAQKSAATSSASSDAQATGAKQIENGEASVAGGVGQQEEKTK